VTATRRSRKDGRERRIAPLGYAIGTALLALASSLVALVFTLWPELKPDPRERLGADVAVFSVEPGVRYGDWLERTSPTDEVLDRRREDYVERAALPGQLTAADQRALLGVTGGVAYVRLTIEGFKRRNVRLRWSMYEARSGRRVGDRGFHDVPAAEVDLDAPTDRSVVQLWFPPPPSPGEKFVRVELSSAAGVLLAVADSERF
jgi:hypothetical protein